MLDKLTCGVEEKYLIVLIKAAIEEEVPVLPEACIDWERLYKIADYHKIANLVWFALEEIKEKVSIETALANQWKENRNKAVVREILFDYEREKILLEMEKAEINYLPIKGIWIKECFPQKGMRWMSDNDILYEQFKQKELIGIMSQCGYQAIHLQGNHDVYHKEPIFNFEMHKTLFAENNVYYKYYEKIWDKAIKCKGRPLCYQLSVEDAYVYYFAHLYKHWSGAGAGIRALADIYVIQKKYKKSLKRVYIEEQFEILNLLEFEKQTLRLVEMLFSGGTLSEAIIEPFFYMIESGIYGTFSNLMVNQLKNESGGKKITNWVKLKYCIKRLFPDKKFMALKYPILKKKSYLLVAMYLFRIVKAIGQREQFFFEAKTAFKIENKNYSEKR